jgi:hypothetical protein
MRKMLYLIGGWLALLLGLIGVLLPLLPTTPFVLVSAFCFSRSSERLHGLLLCNRHFGPILREWEEHGVIPIKAKWVATVMMVVMVSYPIIFKPIDLWLKGMMGLTVVFALLYIWSRPSRPRQPTSTG